MIKKKPGETGGGSVFYKQYSNNECISGSNIAKSALFGALGSSIGRYAGGAGFSSNAASVLGGFAGGLSDVIQAGADSNARY